MAGTSSSPRHPSNGTAAEGEDRLGQKRKMEEARAGIIIMALNFHIWMFSNHSGEWFNHTFLHLVYKQRLPVRAGSQS